MWPPGGSQARYGEPAFLAAPDVFLKLFGVGLASAIFLDDTVVRMVLVPAVKQLLGDRNWWIPSWLERVLPRVDVEPVAVGAADGRR
jgi:putative drug exporter of the RND superfamily